MLVPNTTDFWCFVLWSGEVINNDGKRAKHSKV
ncbi:predicted protein [Sclerotinia sclerotiorum 1980 UF-70]|uniref:Uncharacterized protein n=1 Tax=Sclerotinia sclerotiorum (strain ATCC 18683 / 1980 / Ss-1) TaxID=665079 RepID=A7EP59_SCLS1|nr:predicted protein [Sclerotinia sclerotiorum 1980 UF-70]EDO04625.1 predicted protein [Sclerotinia sclerotiorum 1980 UF-70]